MNLESAISLNLPLCVKLVLLEECNETKVCNQESCVNVHNKKNLDSTVRWKRNSNEGKVCVRDLNVLQAVL